MLDPTAGKFVMAYRGQAWYRRIGGACVAAAVIAAGVAGAPSASANPGDVSTVAGGGLDTTLRSGYGLATSPDGTTLYIVDNTGQIVTRDLSTGHQQVFAGTGNDTDPLGDGGAATAASLEHPFAIALDGQGDVFVSQADGSGTDGCRIRKIDAAGTITTWVGDGDCNQSDGDDGVLATSAHIGGWTFAMAADPAGNLYIPNSSAVRKVDTTGHISTVAGQLNSGGQTVDGDTTANARFACLGSAVIDPNNASVLYVSDSCQHAIYKIDFAHDVVHPVVGGGLAPYGVEVGDHPSPDPDNYNTDYNGSFSGIPVAESRVDFSDHVPMAISPSGELYFGDGRDNNDPQPHVARLRKLSADGQTVTDVLGTGPYGSTGDRIQASDSLASKFRGLAFDSSGGLYVSAESTNLLFYVDTGSDSGDQTCPSRVGSAPCVFNAASTPYVGDGGQATDAHLKSPVDLVRVGHDLYVADQQDNRVRKINWKTGIITTFAGTGTQGSTGDGGPATHAELSGPAAIAYDPTGTGAILIAGSDAKIRRVDLHTNVITTVAGDGNTCADPTAVSHPCGDGGPATEAQLGDQVGGVAVKADGTVVVADTVNHRIRQIDPSTHVITTIAGTGVEPAGTSSDDGTPALSAELLAPSRVVVEPSTGDVVFSDVCDRDQTLVPAMQGHFADIISHCDGRVRKLVADEHGDLVLTTIAGRAGKLCEPDITSVLDALAPGVTLDPSVYAHDDTPGCGDGGPATSASIRGPAALRFDAAGNLYIGEVGGTFFDYMLGQAGLPGALTLYPDIRKVSHVDHTISTVAGLDAGFSGDGGPASAARFDFPGAFAPDQGTHLFVADFANGRIRRIEGPRPDLRVSLSADDPLTAGSSGVVHVTVRNAAAADSDAYLTGPVSTDVTLPAELSYASASVTSASVASWSCDGAGQSVSCATPDNVAPQASSTFDVTVNVAPDAEGVVTVNATGASDSDVIDPDHQVAVLGISIRRPASSGSDRGYVLVGADGGTFAFGSASFPGALAVPGNRVVAAAPAAAPGSAPTGAHGAWLATADGSVFTTGDAQFFGSLASTRLNSPIVGIAAHGTDGYWLVAADGGVFAQGSAGFHGSLGATTLNSPIVGMTPTPTGDGYWLVAADGGVFAYGDAVFCGSHGATTLNSPVVGMRATPTGHGYWLVAADGGVFAYGDATYTGSHAGTTLNSPIVAIVATTQGTGYQLVAKDGGVFAYGTATYHGSMATSTLEGPIIAAW